MQNNSQYNGQRARATSPEAATRRVFGSTANALNHIYIYISTGRAVPFYVRESADDGKPSFRDCVVMVRGIETNNSNLAILWRGIRARMMRVWCLLRVMMNLRSGDLIMTMRFEYD